MERELWPVLYRHLQLVAANIQQKYVQYSPWVITAVLLWAALHDRPISWACDRRNWATARLRPARLPDQSTVSRRVRRTAFGFFLNELTARLRGDGLPGLVLTADGKPLLIGGYSQDPDGRVGWGAGQMGRGYKLHVFWGQRPLPEAWDVTALNDAETTVARQLLGQLTGGGYIISDGNFDASPVYDDAAARGYQWVAAIYDPHAGAGHHYQSPHRSRAIALLTTAFGRALFAERPTIERRFGNATSFGGGLAPLPAWVRRQHRVELWVWAKLMINAARIRRQQHHGLAA